MNNLLDIMAAPYPAVPGFKARETSQSAADSVRPKAARLQRLCLDALAQQELTADECADALQIDKLSIRPRFSELAARGKIRDTGVRRPNASGRSAIVWAVAQ